MRRKYLWDTALGFVGFFTFLAVVQAVLNVFAPAPALWPGLVAGALCGLEYLLWRARARDLRRT